VKTIVLLDDADDLDAAPAPPAPKYAWPTIEPRLDRVRGDSIISSEQLALEQRQVDRGERTIAEIMLDYHLDEYGRKLPSYKAPTRQS
jgi:hypothetical protein